MLERPCAAYVTGVDKRVTVTVDNRDDSRVAISAAQFKAFFDGDYKNGSIIPRTADESTLNATKFVRKALEVAGAFLTAKGKAFNGVSVKTQSDKEFGFGASKAGLGSSAAVTVATVAALFAAKGLSVDNNREEIHKCSQIAHSLVQGKVGSGFDVAAACYGGCKYSRYSPELVKSLGETPSPEEISKAVEAEWDYSIEPIPMPEQFAAVIASFNGESTSTSIMVQLVNAWKANNADEYKELIASLDAANREAIAALAEGDMELFREKFVEGRALTKELGVKSGAPIESDEYTRLIGGSEENGAFVAKLPGAGGGDAIAALCISPDEAEQLREYWNENERLTVLDVSFANEGVRAETR